ncbi:MAG: hypothetical protein EPO16_11390 [Dehalococcoidia bacterium]|nr:MAG: hypothetical protein EPO16_11390 [Dehalococcoidia bacterium]
MLISAHPIPRWSEPGYALHRQKSGFQFATLTRTYGVFTALDAVNTPHNPQSPQSPMVVAGVPGKEASDAGDVAMTSESSEIPDRLSRQELYELVWSEPVHHIAPRFEVSDVWLAKVCRAANIPLPPRGYWAKIQHGKAVTRLPLPRIKPGASEQVIVRSVFSRPRRPASDDQVTVRMSASSPIPIPDQLRKPHPFVAATQVKAKAERPQEDGRIYVRAQPGVFPLRVSRDAVSRALRLLQAICDEAGRREWTVKSLPADRYREAGGGTIAIGRHAYPVSIEERTEAIPFTDEEVRRWRANRPSWVQTEQPSPHERRRRPTGELALLIPSAWNGGRARWADGKRSRVEEKLAEFFATLEVRAATDEVRRQEAERAQIEREAQERLARIQKARIERLDRELAAARYAEDIRRYVTRIRARLTEASEDQREQLLAWCEWAEARADRVDPATNLGLIKGFDDERDGRGW